MNENRVSRRRHLELNTCLLASWFAAAGTAARAAEEFTESSSMLDLNSLKESLVKVLADDVVGVGFIAKMEGRTYVVTSVNVVSGHNKLGFETLSGQSVAPRKIELSATRGIARFLVNDQKAFPLAAPTVNDSIAVPDYAKGRDVANHSGVITDMSEDMIEVSAEFDGACRGAPLTKSNQSVAGVASHLVYYKAKDDGWKGTTRAFAYKLKDAAWYATDWRAYNKTMGKSLRDADEFRASVYEVASKWVDNMKAPIETDVSVNLDFERWVKAHNGMISDLDKTVSANSRADANQKLQDLFQKICEELVELCREKADTLWFLAEDKKATKYMRVQFKWRSLELKKFCGFVGAHAKRNARMNWI